MRKRKSPKFILTLWLTEHVYGDKLKSYATYVICVYHGTTVEF